MQTEIPGVLIRELTVHGDGRGQFAEIYRASAMPESFAQSNHSRSAAGVLRGLHYHQHQADLWYLVSGRAQVGLVDLRRRDRAPVVESHILDAEVPTSIYIPHGVAHGYLALTQIDLIYWVTSEYDPADENGIAWDDPALGLEWQISEPPVVSARDVANPRLAWDLIPSFS